MVHLADGGRQIGLFDSHSCSWTAARFQLCRPATSRQFPSVFLQLSSHTDGVDVLDRKPCCLGYGPGRRSMVLIQFQTGMFGLLSSPNVFTPTCSLMKTSLDMLNANYQQQRLSKQVVCLNSPVITKGIFFSPLQENVPVIMRNPQRLLMCCSFQYVTLKKTSF